jgi:hypothetical protein
MGNTTVTLPFEDLVIVEDSHGSGGLIRVAAQSRQRGADPVTLTL